MRQRLPVIAFVVGLLITYLTYRLVDLSIYWVVVLVAIAATAILYRARGTHELARDAAFPFAGGFAGGGVIKWVIAAMFAQAMQGAA